MSNDLSSMIRGNLVTTTIDRPSRTTFDLLSFLPLALVITMFGMAVAIAQVAPSRVTSGVYQVIVGEGPAQFRLATESLNCSRIGDKATCAAPVAGRQLTIDVEYRNFDLSMKESTCTAHHGDRQVPCTSNINYGHAVTAVRISDQLGVTEPELSRLRDAVPWWRTGYEPNLLIAPTTSTPLFFVALLFKGLWVPAVLLALWQYQVCSVRGHDRADRWAHTISAATATALYTPTAIFLFLLSSGFID